VGEALYDWNQKTWSVPFTRQGGDASNAGWAGPTDLGIEYKKGAGDYDTTHNDCAYVQRRFVIGYCAEEVAAIDVAPFEPDTVGAGAVGELFSSRGYGGQKEPECPAACQSKIEHFTVNLPNLSGAGGFSWSPGSYTFQTPGSTTQSWNPSGTWTALTITDGQIKVPHNAGDPARYTTTVAALHWVTASEGYDSYAGADGWIEYGIATTTAKGQMPQHYQDSLNNGENPDCSSAYAFQDY
jgi:hypothetical protein